MKPENRKKKCKNVRMDEKMRRVENVNKVVVDGVDCRDEIDENQRGKLFDGSINNQQIPSYVDSPGSWMQVTDSTKQISGA